MKNSAQIGKSENIIKSIYPKLSPSLAKTQGLPNCLYLKIHSRRLCWDDQGVSPGCEPRQVTTTRKTESLNSLDRFELLELVPISFLRSNPFETLDRYQILFKSNARVALIQRHRFQRRCLMGIARKSKEGFEPSASSDVSEKPNKRRLEGLLMIAHKVFVNFIIT